MSDVFDVFVAGARLYSDHQRQLQPACNRLRTEPRHSYKFEGGDWKFQYSQ